MPFLRVSATAGDTAQQRERDGERTQHLAADAANTEGHAQIISILKYDYDQIKFPSVVPPLPKAKAVLLSPHAAAAGCPCPR